MSYDPEIDHISRELKKLRYDKQYHDHQSRRVVSMKGMCELIGCSRPMLYSFTMPDGPPFNPSRHFRDRLLFVIDLVVNQGCRWHHYKKKWRPIMPDGSLPKIPPEMRDAQTNRKPRLELV